MRWYILQALLVKEWRRHLANRGGIALALLLVAAAVLLSVFAPEEVVWVAAHTYLLGDPRLGPEQLQRFLPTRFDVDGNAVDAKAFPCHSLACPRCQAFCSL